MFAHRKNRATLNNSATLGVTLLGLMLCGTDSAVAESDDVTSIHRYSVLSSQNLADIHQAVHATRSGHSLQLNVAGKRLALQLEQNTHLTEYLPAGQTSTALRGTVNDASGSWVRITSTSHGVQGLIWDGSELYAIESAATAQRARSSHIAATDLTATDTASDKNDNQGTVIFKLSDTTIDLGNDYCGTETAAATSTTGLATYQELITDLGARANDSAPTMRLEMQAIGDAAFRAQYSSDQAALDALLVRLNNIDGIFSTQLGLEIQATDIQVYTTDPEALSTSTRADTLLNSLGQMRKNNPIMSSYATTHLFTGRDLDGDTLGIAYIGNICGARYGVSLSEVRNRGAWIDALVAAHELGHQLGAVHDGTGACADTATDGYLMSSIINGSRELSQCSRDAITATMQYAACLVPLNSPIIDTTTDTSTATSTNDATDSNGGGGAFSYFSLLALTLLAWRRQHTPLKPVRH